MDAELEGYGSSGAVERLDRRGRRMAVGVLVLVLVVLIVAVLAGAWYGRSVLWRDDDSDGTQAALVPHPRV